MRQLSRFIVFIIIVSSLGVSQFALALSVIRGPYLQMASDSAVTIRWRTDSSADSVVRFGGSPGGLNQNVTVSGGRTEHEVRITGLNDDSLYYYSVGTSGTTLAGGDSSYRFATSPATGTSVATRVWLIGDAGTANANQAAVYNAYLNHSGSAGTDLWIMLGDNAYNDGTDSEYQAAVFNMYPQLLRRSTLWATLGNHDGHSADSGTESGPYYNIFTLPRNAEAGGLASGTEAYYSFDYGDIHFICLDSYDTDRSVSGDMMTWLENDLAATTQPWIIAFWHHPPYTKGSHNSDTESALIQMRQNALPILENYGVDLVFSGHSHSYERSYFIDGHYGASGTFGSMHQVDSGDGQADGDGAYTKAAGASNAGTVYTVAGSSGKTSGGSLNHPAMFASLNQLGSVVLDINGNQLDAKFLNSSGNVTDYYTLIKGSDTSPPTLVSANAPGGNSVSVVFSEALNEAGAETGGNYSINGGVSVSSATLQGDNKTVLLSTSALTQNTTYTLTVNNVEDLNNNEIAANSQINFSWLNEQTVSFQQGVNSYNGAEDTYIGDGVPGSNFGSSTTILADGDDGANGELVTLAKWNVGSIPAGATVTDAKIEFDVFNPSSGAYSLWAGDIAWSESGATWNNIDPYNNRGAQVGSFTPSTTGVKSVQLNPAGIGMVQDWVNGSSPNNGVFVITGGTTDGIDMRASEYGTAGSRPRLIVTYGGGGSSSSSSSSSSSNSSSSSSSSSSGSSGGTVNLQNGLNGYSGTQDTYVASGATGGNWGSSSAILADGGDGSNGELISLLKWDVSSIPSGATVVSAAISLQVFNQTNGAYNLWAMLAGWSEGSATWSNTLPESNRGSQIGGFSPTSTGGYQINLNAAGIALVQGWINGSGNNGIMIETGGTTDGVDMRSSEYGTSSQRPGLTVVYQ